MIAYFDTSLLVGRYIAQPVSSAKAIAASEEAEQIIVSEFTLFELRNALRAACFRKEISTTQLANALLAVEEDAHSEVLMQVSMDWPDLISVAEEIAGNLIASKGGRTLDILHLAIAYLSDIKHFYTADQRQASCAEMMKFKVKVF